MGMAQSRTSQPGKDTQELQLKNVYPYLPAIVLTGPPARHALSLSLAVLPDQIKSILFYSSLLRGHEMDSEARLQSPPFSVLRLGTSKSKSETACCTGGHTSARPWLWGENLVKQKLMVGRRSQPAIT